MFGANDNTQTSNDDPAMLDNVKQLAQEPADKVSPPPQFMTSSAQQQTNQFTATPAPAQNPDPYMTQPAQQSPTMPQNDDIQTSSAPADDSSQQAAIAEPAQGFSSEPLPDSSAVEENSENNPNTPVDTQEGIDPSQSAADDSSQNDPIAASPMTVITPADPQQLAGMKQQALDHLEPLVDHLEQSPEESFKTTMMMIQANDNHTLLEKALEQAKNIEDDKTRANAMLDIINEINYFSQTNQE